MKEFNDEVFRRRLKTILKLEGLTQEQLAELMGVAQSIICRWLSGQFMPTAKAIVKLSQALNVSTDFLLGLSNNPNRR